MFPSPKGKQKDVLYLAARGYHAVLGTAGSGKVLDVLDSLLKTHRQRKRPPPLTRAQNQWR